jgi:phosphoribosylformylglycinamidine synthase
VAPRILILHVSGTNRDREVAVACEMVGGAPEIVHVNQLRAGERAWGDFQMLVLPGGFAYGDALGAGRLTALDLRAYFADEVRRFVASDKPVLGICNGFQALVKAGILPGGSAPGDSAPGGSAPGGSAPGGSAPGGSAPGDSAPGGSAPGGSAPGGSAPGDSAPKALASPEAQSATLTRNAQGRFECRWVTLIPQADSPSIFTRGLSERIYCPVAHGEGNFIPRDADTLSSLKALNQIALVYGRIDGDGEPARGRYPDNPNGSVADIAGVCNPAGNVLGLMPHPEDHIYPWQHPRWTRGESGGSGLALFRNAIAQL